MIELFEFVISPSDRIITGAVYTPNNVREYIVQNILDNQVELNGHWKGSDIACGCGGFLYTIAKHLKKRINTTYSHIFSKQLLDLTLNPILLIGQRFCCQLWHCWMAKMKKHSTSTYL